MRRLGRSWFDSETPRFAGWKDALTDWVQVIETMVPPPEQPAAEDARPT